jgi:RNA polymerase sigma-70 factor, ECF subfamily
VPNPPDDEERLLIERAKGDPEAFGVLFDRHFPAVFAYVFHRVANWDAAKDLTSEVFFKALRGLWRYRWTRVPFTAWLFTIATNEVRMYFRRGRRAPLSLDALMRDAGLDPPDPATLEAERREAERLQASDEEFARVQRDVLALPMKYQEVIALRFFEQKSIAEIAAILSKREGTIKSILSRGLAKLRVQRNDASRIE